MTPCITGLTLPHHPRAPRIDVSFDGPKTSSDGGLLLLRQVDGQLGLTEGFAALLRDERCPNRIKHSRLEQLRQRVYQIAQGYEDCNDAQSLRRDPVLLTVCDRTPADPDGLSSQPTLSRFESSVDMATVRRFLLRLEQSYVEGLAAQTEVVILDIDTTDDPTHGNQQLSFFHGYYDHHMYHPLLVYDGLSGELITAVLRPGNAHASRGAMGVLRRLIRSIKQRLPHAQVVVRADSGFCTPRVLEELERLDAQLGDVDYVIGIAKNSVLLRNTAPLRDEAAQRYQSTHRHVRLVGELAYAAKSWSRTRHTIVKAEHAAKGENPRFVLTSIEGFAPELIYDAYCERGQSENYIKDFKSALAADRLSCSSFVGNFFRLLLHALAYRLMHALRTHVAAVSPTLGRAQFDTLRVRLLKVAITVKHSVRRLWMQLPAAFPLASVFYSVACRLMEHSSA